MVLFNIPGMLLRRPLRHLEKSDESKHIRCKIHMDGQKLTIVVLTSCGLPRAMLVAMEKPTHPKTSKV